MMSLGLTFARPAALLLLATLPIFLFLGVRFGLRRRRLPRPALWLRAATIALLSLALAEPLLTTGGGTSSTVFVVDQSRSISPEVASQATEWVETALADSGRSARAAIITFGSSPILAQPAERTGEIGNGWTDSTLPPEEATNTDIQSALALARALPLGGSRRLVLLSDGAENAGDVLFQANEAAAERIPIDVVPLPGVGADDLRIDGASAPSSTWQGEPFEVLVSVASGGGGAGSVELWIDGALKQSIPATFDAGLTSFQFDVTDLEPGFHALETRVVSTTAVDTYAENNRQPLALVVRDQPHLLLVAPDGSDVGTIRGALERRGARVDLTNPGGLPSQLSAIAEFDAIVLNNVPVELLALDQLAALREATRSLGRGLIVLGGTSSYGPGGYAGTVLEETLPVTVKVTEGRERERVALLLIVDRSGSMSYDPLGGSSKIDMAKEAVTRAASSLADGDIVGILAFDNEQQWIIEMTEITGDATRREIANKVAAVEPEGGTEIYPALSLGFDAISNVEADAKHIVLLTDGKSRTGTRESYQQLLDQVVTANTTLSSIAVGEDADQELLQFLSEEGNGRYHFTNRPEDIPRVTLEEAQSAGSQSVLRGVFQPIQTQPSPIMAAFDPETLPQLDGYDFAEAKPNAQVVLTSDRNDPLLAKWQYGLGRVVAWTGDDGADFARAWTSWDRYDEFWAGVVRWSLPDPDARPLRINAERDGNETVLTVDALAPDGGYVDLAETAARVTSPSGAITELTLFQTAPGQYQARVAAPDPGAYQVELSQTRGNVTLREMTGFAVPPSPELQPQPGAGALLRAIAARTNGRVLGLDDASLAFSGASSDGEALRHFRPIWYLPLALGLLTLLAEIAIRMGFTPWRRP
ncbi:MAG TPA: VWA domain-containing protein [Thermomicrobiales bacterium]|nr:VWA domain-containing protein [Thermomicrobiales bacterium]